MSRGIFLPLFLLLALCGSLALALGRTAQLDKPAPASAPVARTLPGLQPGGQILLPNQWSLRPAGRQLALGDFPVNLALHPTGRWLAVLHAGFGTHEVVIVELLSGKERISCRVPLEQTWYGLCFSTDGKTLYASGAEFEIVHAFAFEDGLLARRRPIRVALDKEKFIPGGLALDREGKTLFAAGTWGHAVRIVPADPGADSFKPRSIDLGPDSYPYACLPTPDGKSLFVSLWGKAGVTRIDLATDKVAATWPCASHPTEMALSPDGKALYVACANSTRVDVLDTATGKGLETISCALYPTAPSGNTPASLSLSPDGELLFVANADANNLAVFNVTEPGKAQPLGFIPAGWYPTAVRFNPSDRRIYVANGKGITSRANPQGPGPYANRRLGPLYQYIAGLMQGTLGIINLPTPRQMVEYRKTAYNCSPLRADAGVIEPPAEDNPIPREVGGKSPIQYVIYIIKENRTYDQVFGDMKEGNGDPALCLFGEKETPNHHKLAREFVLLDNFYVEGEVSADGHEWSMGAYATDFIEKVWPLTYRGSPHKKLPGYPAEGAVDVIARPSGGYIWDRCKEAGVSYRSYGEWVVNGKMQPDGSFEDGKALVKTLEGHVDPKFRSFDMRYPDQKRADRFIEELKRFEKEGGMPRLSILRLPNDHTAGTQVGMHTPRAYLADNDLALGRVVEAISQSKFWKETAIFSIEDDAQNGPDHVDAHRTVALVISPYTKRRHVDSTLYSTSSMLRTMELILGLKPMSQFDAAARPMYASFQAKAELTPYKHLVPAVDREEKNKKDAFGAALSATFDMSKEDMADDLLFNEVIWHAVKGPDVPMPAPVRAAFVFPHMKDKD
jgi:DNA-binding beta-propeller fold protein YncE